MARALSLWPPLVAGLRLPRIGNDLLELRHGQHPRHPKLADNKGRRAPESERGGLMGVARQDGVDRLGVAGEVAVEAIDIDTGAGEQLTDPRLGQLRVD